MWEIDVSGQIYTLLQGLILGGAFCAVFDLYSVIRRALHLSDVVVFFTDVLMLALFGVITFLFFLAKTKGEVRGYVFVSEAVGFFCFRLTLSRFLQAALGWIVLAAKWLKKLLSRAVFTPIRRFFDVIIKKIGEIGLKSVFFIKKRLKKPRKMVYTEDNCFKE